MKARAALGIVGGVVAWWALFVSSLVLLAMSWPALGAAGKHVRESGDYSVLTTPMLALMLSAFPLINVAAGWIASRIAGRTSTIWLACAPTFAYAAYQHLHVLWHSLPAWYNLGVVGFIYPFGWLGAYWSRCE